MTGGSAAESVQKYGGAEGGNNFPQHPQQDALLIYVLFRFYFTLRKTKYKSFEPQVKLPASLLLHYLAPRTLDPLLPLQIQAHWQKH